MSENGLFYTVNYDFTEKRKISEMIKKYCLYCLYCLIRYNYLIINKIAFQKLRHFKTVQRQLRQKPLKMGHFSFFL